MTSSQASERTTIGDPVSEAPVVPYEKLEEVFEDIRSHVLFDHELHGCLNCGICTATCITRTSRPFTRCFCATNGRAS